MPRAPRSKAQPDPDTLVLTSVAALDRDGVLARSAVGPPSVRDRVLEILRGRGYEVTTKVVRVPLQDQIETALKDGSYIAMKTIGAHVRGATAKDARRAALSLVERGRARWAIRTNSETLVPISTDVVAEKELTVAAKRVSELAKTLHNAARKGKKVGVLRADIQEALDVVLTPRPPSITSRAELSPELARVLRAVDKARDVGIGLSFVPKVAALLAPDLDVAAAKKTLLEAASRGLLELRPEGGLGRLSDAEREACPEGPQGTRLSWARRIEVHS
jgi:hypothetical protein